MNFVYLDNDHILHKEGIIININNLEIIQTTCKNKIIFKGFQYNMARLMIKHFYNIDSLSSIEIDDIYHIDGNYYNNSLANLYYKNLYKKNLYNNLVKYKYIINIEQYDIDYKIKNYSNLINNSELYDNCPKDLIIKLLNSAFVIYKNEYWKMNIKKIKISDLNNCCLYTAIPQSEFYISNDRSHVINHNRILLIIFDKDYKYYYSNVYLKKEKRFEKIYLDFYNFIDIPFDLFIEDKSKQYKRYQNLFDF